MNTLDLASSVSEAKQLIKEEYQQGYITEEEKEFKEEHLLGW